MFLLLALAVHSENPGARAGCTIGAVSSFKDNVLPIIFANIGRINIGDVHGTIGHSFYAIDINVNNFFLNGLTFDEGDSTVEF
jgi:hypothetical protein